MLKNSIVIFFLLFSIHLFSQNLNAFLGANNRFYVFDSGLISLQEFQPVSNISVSNKYIVYTDTRGDYYVRFKGQKTLLSRTVTKIYNTNNFLYFNIASALKVFNNGKQTVLTSFVQNYAGGDSIVVFQDQIGGNLKYFYNDSIVEFAQALGEQNLNKSIVGENVFVFKDNAGNNFGFYNHRFYELFSSNQYTTFSSGLNVIAFNDPQHGTFAVFRCGEVVDVEPQHVKSFKAGRDFVYYFDAARSNKVYYNNQITDLGFDLQELAVYDSIIFFKEADYGNIWYNNQIHTIFNRKVGAYQVDNGILAFQNELGGVSAFVRGEVIDVTNRKVESFWLHGSTIAMQFGPTSFSVWWNGKTYDL